MRKIYRLFALLTVLNMIATGASAAGPVISGGTVTLPASLEVIEEEAFFNDKSIERAILPERIKAICAKAFADSGLQEIYLPPSLEFIENTAFSGLTEIVISADKGSYAYCWAVDHGYIVKPIDPGDEPIIIADPPEPPTNVTVSGISDSKIEIYWTKSPSIAVDKYKVLYNTTNNPDTALVFYVYDSDTQSATVFGLKPLTRYYFWVQAVNDAGASEISSECSSSAWTLYK